MVAAYTYRSGPPRLVPLLGGVDVLIPQPPTSVSMSPTSAMPGEVVTLTGSWVGAATTTVTFNGTSASFTIVDNDTVLATVPGTATSGVIRVTTLLGSAQTSGSFTVVPVPPPNTITPPAGFTTFVEDQFADNSLNRWSVYHNSTFGADANNLRIQRYMNYNAVFGQGSAGSMGGTSLKLLTKRELVGGNNFTAGMVDSKSAGVFYPRYGYMEARCKIPHGHGMWPAFWFTAKNGGASMSEWDWIEYFHGQVPGKNSSTLHGTDNTGTFHANRYTNNVGGRTFFEAPTYTPGWHKWATEILPVTDATGNTIADVTQPSSFVRFRVLLDGVQVYRFVDTSALYWTTNGGSEDSFWNVYIQGCQIDGNFIGHPDGELAYSEYRNACLIGGTPGSCTKTAGGYPVIRAGAPGSQATFSDPATTFEIDYFYCAKYTG